MRRNVYILITALLTLTALFCLSGCDDGDDNVGKTYYPETLKVNFYSDPDEAPMSTYTVALTECQGSGESMARKVWENAPDIEIEGYHFRGYTLEASEYYPIYTGEGDIMLRSSADMKLLTHLDDYEKYYNLYYELMESEPTEYREMNLYVWWEPYTYSFIFKGLANYGSVTDDTPFTRVDRSDEVSKCHNAYRSDYKATIDYMEHAPGGYTDTQEIAGWQDSQGRLIFDYTGRPVLSAEETFKLFTNYDERENDGWSFCGSRVELYPVVDNKFSVITFNYSADGASYSYGKAHDGSSAADIEYPNIYLDGKYVVDWSLSSASYVPFDGTVTKDITLYAVWMSAKEIKVSYDGSEERLSIYLLEDGRIIYDVPKTLENHEINGWYSDPTHTAAIKPSYANMSTGDELYVTWQLAKKSVTLNANNGDIPYEIYLHADAENNDFALPVWEGYEIEGWYTSRACDGDPVELDFDSVTDGTTYYAKWVKIN